MLMKINQSFYLVYSDAMIQLDSSQRLIVDDAIQTFVVNNESYKLDLMTSTMGVLAGKAKAFKTFEVISIFYKAIR